MLNLVYMITIIFIFILELITCKKVLHKNLLTYLMILFLVILMGGSLYNPDSDIYINIYERDFFTKDIGFGVLILGFKTMGITYNSFRLIVAIIGIFLIHQTVKKFVKNKSYFYMLYGIYPFLFDIVQLRNFLAMSLFIYAVPWLIESRNKSLFKYIFVIGVAASIQKVAIVYLPLILVRNLKRKNFLKIVIGIAIICSVLIGINKNLILAFSNSILFFLSEDLTGLSNYLNVNTNLGWVIFWGEQLANFLLVFWATKIIKNYVENGVESNYYSQITITFSSLIYNINLYMFIFLPLFVLDENFTRIIRNVMPLNLMVYCIAISLMIQRSDYSMKYSYKKTIRLVFFIFLTLSYQIFLLLMLFSSYWDSIVLPVFKNNWIW